VPGFWQRLIGVVTVGAVILDMIVTVMAARSLSQPFTVWLTYHVVVPAVAEEGVGAVLEPVPPVGTVYQRRAVPVAVSVVVVAFRQ
jgi:hypothetical protein